MFDLQSEVTRAVKKYLRTTGASVTSLAIELELSRPALSNRLHGCRSWQSGDIKKLHEMGVIHIITDLEYGYEADRY